jgi:hypothetical protein
MTNVALESAMRLGDCNPLQKRESRDLGRFGLGMKTAAFSQGRRLTVASRTATGEFSCFSWDLEILRASEDGAAYIYIPYEARRTMRSPQHQRQGTAALFPLGCDLLSLIRVYPTDHSCHHLSDERFTA